MSEKSSHEKAPSGWVIEGERARAVEREQQQRERIEQSFSELYDQVPKMAQQEGIKDIPHKLIANRNELVILPLDEQETAKLEPLITAMISDINARFESQGIEARLVIQLKGAPNEIVVAVKQQ